VLTQTQAVSSGKYVVASASNTNLVASASAASGASKFASAWRPNAGTLQLSSTAQFITADASGSYALSASRDSASAWETFVVRQKAGAASGVYTIKASSNGLYVTLGSDGSLLNNGASAASAAGFKFVAA
jgi:endo-1,3(4)-beta-glucanase